VSTPTSKYVLLVYEVDTVSPLIVNVSGVAGVVPYTNDHLTVTEVVVPLLYTPPPLTVNLYGNIASSNLFTLSSKSLRSPPLPVPDSYQVPSNVASPLLLIVPYAIVSVPTIVPAFKVPPLKYIAHPSGIVIVSSPK
jgi:hypothetical protein